MYFHACIELDIHDPVLLSMPIAKPTALFTGLMFAFQHETSPWGHSFEDPPRDCFRTPEEKPESSHVLECVTKFSVCLSVFYIRSHTIRHPAFSMRPHGFGGALATVYS